MPRFYVIPPGLLPVPTYPALKRWAKLFRTSGAGSCLGILNAMLAPGSALHHLQLLPSEAVGKNQFPATNKIRQYQCLAGGVFHASHALLTAKGWGTLSFLSESPSTTQIKTLAQHDPLRD